MTLFKTVFVFFKRTFSRFTRFAALDWLL